MKKLKVNFLTFVFFTLTLVACGGGGGGGSGGDGGNGGNIGGGNPSSTGGLTGTWLIFQGNGDNDCGDPVSELETVTATISQSGNTVTATLPNGNVSGNRSGNQLTLTGNLDEGNGSSAVTLNLQVLSDNAVGGLSEFEYTEAGFRCSGNVIVGAIRQRDAVGNSVNADIDAGGEWTVTETTAANNCGDAEGVSQQYSVNVTQSDTSLFVSGPAFFEGELRGRSGMISAAYADFNSALLVSINGLTVAADGNSFTGIGGFTFVDTQGFACVGSHTLVGTRDSTVASPTNLTVTSLSSTDLELNWRDNADNETAYKIYRTNVGPVSSASIRVNQVNNKFMHGVSAKAMAMALVAELPADSTSYLDSGLEAGHEYQYIVEAVNEFGASESNSANGVTEPAAPPAQTIPLPPTGLQAASASASTIALNWNDNSDNGDGFKVFQSDSQSGPWTQIGLLNSQSTTFNADNLSASTTYFFQVLAFNGAGDSLPSNTASATTDAPPIDIPAAPSGMTVANVTSSSASLSWIDNSNNEDGFHIQICSLASSRGGCGLYTTVATVGVNVTRHELRGLNADTSYTYYVRAFNSAGGSSRSSVDFTTLTNVGTEIVVATFDNLLLISSQDASLENNNYTDSDIAVGCNWVFGVVTGIQDYVCAASLLYFDIDSLIDGKNIIAARLLLQPYILPADLNDTYKIRAVAQNWSPATVTYTNQPNVFVDPAIVINPPTTAAVPMEFDVTEIIQNWADGTYPNFGLHVSNTNFSFPFDSVLRATAVQSLEVFSQSNLRPTLEITLQ